jgi:hypothetical protein
LGFPTPQDAEAAFYTAFESKNIDDMMQVWSSDSTIECIHPMGNRLVGRQAIEDSWRRVFMNESDLVFKVEGAHYMQSSMIAVHVVSEKIALARKPGTPTTVIATNVYQLTDQGWKMVLHHASLSQQAEPEEQDPDANTLH